MEENGINGIKWNRKNECFFECKTCDFKCFYKSDWLRHLSKGKDSGSLNGKKNGIKKTSWNKKNERHSCDCGRSYSTKSNLQKHLRSCGFLAEKNECFICDCKRSYSNKSNLIKHKKICEKTSPDESPKNELNIYDLVKYVMKENSELKYLVIDQSNKMFDQNNKLMEHSYNNVASHTTNNTIHNNSHNKAFNLNFFLNETCKNAMNITDFVDSIKLQLSDLISVGELGYVEGISNIIVKQLNALDETERPFHCTDKKRETIYIKDENKWEKDDEDKKKLRKMIHRIAYKNQNMFPKFKEKYPDYNDSDSKRSDQYSKIVIESMCDSDKDNQDKIIKRISKEVFVDK